MRLVLFAASSVACATDEPGADDPDVSKHEEDVENEDEPPQLASPIKTINKPKSLGQLTRKVASGRPRPPTGVGEDMHMSKFKGQRQQQGGGNNVEALAAGCGPGCMCPQCLKPRHGKNCICEQCSDSPPCDEGCMCERCRYRNRIRAPALNKTNHAAESKELQVSVVNREPVSASVPQYVESPSNSVHGKPGPVCCYGGHAAGAPGAPHTWQPPTPERGTGGGLSAFLAHSAQQTNTYLSHAQNQSSAFIQFLATRNPQF